MTPERWRQIERVYSSALEFEENQRCEFLGRACAGDEELRIEVESLLASHWPAAEFLVLPALDMAAKTIAEDQT